MRARFTDRRSPAEARLTSATAIEVLDSRVILQLELDGIKLIEASAGTGKTHTIADLYLRHILAGRTTAQILIVTFTNAATEELRGRIQNRLYQAVTVLSDNDSEADEFLQLLREQFRQLDGVQQELLLARLQLPFITVAPGTDEAWTRHRSRRFTASANAACRSRRWPVTSCSKASF